jgi:DNA-binding MarR family transcriptional regulator
MPARFDDSESRSARRRKGERWDAAQADLIFEITETAARIAAARGPNGDAVVRTGAVWGLLSTIARSHYCCSLSDVGRLMKVSRQRVQRLARAAERTGVVELARNHDDRRIVQLLLTRRGRSEIDAARRDAKMWTARLLLGLDMPRLMTATHVVRVIHQRLVRDAHARGAAAGMRRPKNRNSRG